AHARPRGHAGRPHRCRPDRDTAADPGRPRLLLQFYALPIPALHGRRASLDADAAAERRRRTVTAHGRSRSSWWVVVLGKGLPAAPPSRVRRTRSRRLRTPTPEIRSCFALRRIEIGRRVGLGLCRCAGCARRRIVSPREALQKRLQSADGLTLGALQSDRETL